MPAKIPIILLVAFCALLGATGQIFFKLGSKTLSLDLLALATNWKLLLGLVFYGIATILFVLALKHGNLSILYPIIATSYVWVTIFSSIFLKEAFPAFKWIGILSILVGVFIIVR
ncbi:EamA family transporter [Candidatus Woesearchaeota archaeon]|nr:EamA family transporter [Candidatus Woesearchaeota archaeon]